MYRFASYVSRVGSKLMKSAAGVTLFGLIMVGFAEADFWFNENGCPVEQCSNYHGGGNQQWKLVDVGEGFVKIVLQPSGKVVQAPPSRVNISGCGIELWDWNGGFHQQWKLIPIGDGWHKLELRSNGWVLEANSRRIKDSGAQLELCGWHGASHQQWKVIPTADGWSRLELRANGFAFDAHAQKPQPPERKFNPGK